MSSRAARELAESIFGKEGCPTWDCEAPRTKEGYFHFAGGVDPAISRVKAFAPYADMLWLETKTPDLKQAQGFAADIHKDFPGKWLVYNLSPSFNWSAHGFDGEYRNSFYLTRTALVTLTDELFNESLILSLTHSLSLSFHQMLPFNPSSGT